MMGRAMGRPLVQTLFGAFGVGAGCCLRPRPAGGRRERAHGVADDIGFMLAYARRVVFVPGYGLAVAQAQHDVRSLGELLEAKGVDVRYAIHPVAGRMPGHMNVLLAEANVPYDELFEMDEINPEFPQTDVVVVVGANDVVNPAARNSAREPDLRDADPRRRQGAQRRRDQALARDGVRGRRQPALLRPEDGDALRRREGGARAARRRPSRRFERSRTSRSSHGAAVEAAVSPERALEAVRDAFVAYARGEWTMPPKVYVPRVPGGRLPRDACARRRPLRC